MLYYGALTGHFGWWVQRPPTDPDQSPAANPAPARRRTKKRLWEWIVDPRLLYGQMVKRYVRRKLHEVTRRMMIGDIAEFIRTLKMHGFSGLIQTAYIERHNLQMRLSASPLIRRTLRHLRQGRLRSLVCSELALARRLELQRGIYHFVKPHGGLRLAMAQPILRAGQRSPQRYQQQTLARAKPPREMAAGLTNHISRLEETLLFPLPAPDIPALPPAQEPKIRRKRSKSECS